MTELSTGLAISTVGNATADLGEGPYWDADSSILLWVDIPAGLLHRTDPETGDTETIDIGVQLSAAFPAEGGLLLARRNELIFRGQGGSRQVVARTDDNPEEIRFNDGIVDPRGRVWIGSMDIDEAEHIGRLYRLEPEGSLSPLVTRVTVSNGLGYSPDGSQMYHIDSSAKRIDVYAYHLGSGELGERRQLADLSDVAGFPDGMTVDADGYLWVAMFAGGALRRYSPAGQLDAVFPLPVSHPTSCAFGGEELRDLFITTASDRLSADERAGQPLAGRLLRMRPGATGQPAASAKAVIPG